MAQWKSVTDSTCNAKGCARVSGCRKGCELWEACLQYKVCVHWLKSHSLLLICQMVWQCFITFWSQSSVKRTWTSGWLWRDSRRHGTTVKWPPERQKSMTSLFLPVGEDRYMSLCLSSDGLMTGHVTLLFSVSRSMWTHLSESWQIRVYVLLLTLPPSSWPRIRFSAWWRLTVTHVFSGPASMLSWLIWMTRQPPNRLKGHQIEASIRAEPTSEKM